MARIATGVSKKSNRLNLEALALAQAWQRQFGIGMKMSPEFAWVFTNGQIGQKPANFGQSGESTPTDHGTAIYDTFKIALFVIKKRSK
jgi:hypothetical protein